MLSFHNDPEIKEKYLNRIKSHKEADRIIQGVGWNEDEEDGIFRGCAVGCTLENYDHSRYPIELGLPEWLAILEDKIFEGIPKSDAIEWPEKFLSVIPVGINVENVRHHLAIKRMDRLIELQKSFLNKYGEELDKVFSQVILSMEIVKECHEAELGKNYCDWSAASAARSADSAAWFPARSAYSAARSAAWSAASSADSAAWKQEASDLLQLLSECK